MGKEMSIESRIKFRQSHNPDSTQSRYFPLHYQPQEQKPLVSGHIPLPATDSNHNSTQARALGSGASLFTGSTLLDVEEDKAPSANR